MWLRFALFNAALAAILTAQPKEAMMALSVGPATGALTVGASQRLVATPRAMPSAAVRLDYRMTDTTVAQVDSTGRVTGRAAGATTLTVRARAEARGFESVELVETVPIAVR